MPEVARGASVGASSVVSPSPKTQLITETVVGVGGRGADRLGGFVCRPHPFDGREREGSKAPPSSSQVMLGMRCRRLTLMTRD